MSWLVRSPVALLVIIAGALAAYAATMRDQLVVVKRVAEDDWRGVRDVATRLLTGERRARGAVVDHAAVVLPVAHLVLGDLAAAGRALDVAESRPLAPPLRAACQRQRASYLQMTGDADGALALLDEVAATAPDDEAEVALHRALVHLGRMDGRSAAGAAGVAAEAVRRHLAGALTSEMRAAHEADLAQAECALVRGLLLADEVDAAGAVWAARTEPAGKPYVAGQLCEAGARLALARRDLATATEQAEASLGWYRSVGAVLDEARTSALAAACRGDRQAVDAAEAVLRERGALGYLPEVAAARRLLDDAG